MAKKTYYLDLVGFKTPEEAYKKIKEWTSRLTDDEHFIRSVIFDIHAGIELLFRQIFYHHFESLLFLTGEIKNDEKVKKSFDSMISRLSFGQMYRILWPIIKDWYPDFKNIQSINDLRNQAAHGKKVNNIKYKGRNPFKNADCFAQVFFDAWAVRKCLTDFYYKAIEDPKGRNKLYYKAYKRFEKLKKIKEL
jgi:hypothetical protein